jgi:hypothetical protein
MAESLMDKAKEIRERAVYHKRQARKHKRLARESMQELVLFCAQNGIKFEVISSEGIDDNDTR